MVNWCTVEKVSPTELFDWVEGVRSGVSAWIMYHSDDSKDERQQA